MPPSPDDLTAARALAARIVAVGLGRVRRVVMIGSRALGTARPDSDLDLVVMVEIRRSERPWGPTQNVTERQRILECLGPVPLKLDLWARTTDRYAEAHRVVGGVEWLAATEGVDVHSRPLDRTPVIRRTPAEVRRQNVSAWMEHAMLAMDASVRATVLRGNEGEEEERVAAARAAVERGINALLVAHGMAAARPLSTSRMMAQLAEADPPAAAWLRDRLPHQPASAGAVRALRAVVQLLQRDPRLAPFLRGPAERLAQPILIL